MRPDLFNAAIMGVPFVDVLTTIQDETIPLTVIEWWVGSSSAPFRPWLLNGGWAVRLHPLDLGY